jgi:hypothetical protein
MFRAVLPGPWLRAALTVPLKRIASNAGLDGAVVAEKVTVPTTEVLIAEKPQTLHACAYRHS